MLIAFAVPRYQQYIIWNLNLIALHNGTE